MSKVVYVGPQTGGVNIRVGDAYVKAAHKAPVDVPDEIAQELLAQEGLWESVKPSRQKDEVA